MDSTNPMTGCAGAVRRRVASSIAAALAVAAVAAVALIGAPAAGAAFGIATMDTDTHTPRTVVDGPTSHWGQAGAHADSSLTWGLTRKSDAWGFIAPDGSLKDAVVDLPPGFSGDLQAVPRCKLAVFNNFHGAGCPPSTQIGVTRITVQGTGDPEEVFRSPQEAPVFNLEPADDELAAFGFFIVQVPTKIVAKLRTDGDYGVRTFVDNVNQGVALIGQDITFWGVPADPVHDFQRYKGSTGMGHPSNAPLRPFLTLPTRCAGPLTTIMSVRPWGGGDWVSAKDVSDDPVTKIPEGPQNCERVPFGASFQLQPTDGRAGEPSGYVARLRTDYIREPNQLANSHLKDVSVTMPDGVAINPSSANGLTGCSDQQLGLDREGDAECPESSKVGAVTINTPVLDAPIKGEMYVREPTEDQLFRLAIVARTRGLVVKVPGEADPDHATGRVTATFENNPQLPFEELEVSLDGGPQAPLVNPGTCGPATTSAVLEPWSGNAPIVSTSAFHVTGDCSRKDRFEPSLRAGTANPRAGGFSPMSMVLSRPDGQRRMKSVDTKLPTGLLAKLAGVPLCPEAQANAGTCGAESRVGHVQSSAGAGSAPLWVPQNGKAPTSVHLSGPYKGAPYSLSVVVPAQAGPYDLGTVVVRVALHVDRRSAQVTAVSDPIPHILEGVPLNLREVRILIDREGFTLNPTSCEEKRFAVTVDSLEGGSAGAESRFQAGDCAALPFGPRLSLALTGRKQVRTGRHPGVKAVVRQAGVGEAGIGRAKVTLPKSLALDPDNAQALCEFEDGTKPDLESHCPKGSIVGRARAKTPLLDEDLVGNVYFVKNVRKDAKTGNAIRTLPMIVVALRGEIAVNLTGKSSTTKDGRLVNTFGSVPDAPISRFNLNIKGGKNGILAVTRTRKAKINLCAKPKGHIAETDWRGQNGKSQVFDVRVKTPCATKKSKRSSKSKSKR